ncbi:FAD-dependent monooxygenase [Actinoplanes sp. NPDC051513]|uniref:FAD-dependent monooxygenase n=1 Tax=Actinoplanes sp. NPDC051513 TaxID=3363908 RepID=UPI0037B81756
MRTVLISGAGVAGPTLAFWLARAGFQPTVVERAQGQRSSGNPVDVRGPALPVAEQMGVVPALREAATTVTAMRLIDSRGRRGARLPMPSSRSAAGTMEIEVPRADLATILYAAARDHAEFVFDDTITAMSQDPDGVDVAFERGEPRRFDLVVGADGLHSTVRRLAIGHEQDFVRHLGVYVATTPLGEPVDHPDEALMYNAPGRLLSVHPSRDHALLAFIFRGGAVPGFDHRDTAAHKKMLLDAYGKDRLWRVPEFLDRARASDDLYFDSVSRVVLPSWSRGRITLLGDAAASVSLFGDGSSMAMAGARTLAGALGEADVETALKRYEAEHRRRTDTKGRAARFAAALIVPSTRPGIAVRNAAARMALRGDKAA